MRANSSFAQLTSGLWVPPHIARSRAMDDWLDEQERLGIPRRAAIAAAIQGTLANDSVQKSADASGPLIATHAPGDGKEYQVVMVADDSGHIQQTLPTYSWWSAATAVGASKLHADIFNAAGSGKIIEIRGVWAIAKTDVAVTATLGVEIGLYRTTSVGTGGNAHTYNNGITAATSTITPMDQNNAALPAQITARTAPTGGAALGSIYWAQYIWTEETNAPATAISSFTNLIPVGTMNQRITIREGEGLLYKQGAVAAAGSIGFLTLFTLV